MRSFQRGSVDELSAVAAERGLIDGDRWDEVWVVAGARVARGVHVTHDRARAYIRAPLAELEDLFIAVRADEGVVETPVLLQRQPQSGHG